MDGATHHAIMRAWVDHGFPPTPAELASTLAVTVAEVEAALGRLAASHGVVLHPGTSEIWIAHPFSASPTTVWVERDDGRGWWAPCVWCAMGIAWANVVHWCATVQPFRVAADVPGWAARHRMPVGAVIPIEQALALGTAWYGRHLDEAWRKWTVAEAQRIFSAVGLAGDVWRLPGGEGTF